MSRILLHNVCISCQELWVRDCITVRSGKRKKDRPYIAKIGSIWRENSGELRNQQGFQFLLYSNREVF